MNENQKMVDDAVATLVSNLLFYDRKESEEFTQEKLEQLLDSGEITTEFILDSFARHLVEGVGVKTDEELKAEQGMLLPDEKPVVPAPDKVWGHGQEEHGRYFGDFKTKGEAIAEGRSCYGRDEDFYIARGTMCAASQFMPESDELSERMGEIACDQVGDAAEDFPDASTEAWAELDDLLVAWANKHLTCRFWESDGYVERVKAESD